MSDPLSDPLSVLDDLRAESQELDAMVDGLPAARWAAATPAEGWTLAHQIAHLAWTDRVAALAVTDQDAFAGELDAARAELDSYVDDAAQADAALPPSALLARWRAGREELQRVLRAAPSGARFPWFGPSMSAAGIATGRIMETWAHGHDVADTLGVVRAPTDRLRHVVRIGVRARNFAFHARGLEPPTEDFRVELLAPSGGTWAHGPEDAAQRVTGTAVDFCLLVTRRAHRLDLDVHAEGADAERWLDIAQAFAGPPGKDPEPGTGRAAAAASAAPERRDDGGPGPAAGGSAR